jgi:predicted ribosomally synthesized peptide with nif11-like leader
MTAALEWAIMGLTTPRPLTAMSEEQLKAFLEAVKANEGLQEQLKAAADADTVVAIAKSAGFAISAEELQRAQAELSEEELEGVAGGNLLNQGYGKGELIPGLDGCLAGVLTVPSC